MKHLVSLTLTAYPDGSIVATHHGPNFTRADRTPIPPGRGAGTKVRLAASRLLAEARAARRGWTAAKAKEARMNDERRAQLPGTGAAAAGGGSGAPGNGAVILALEGGEEPLEFEDLVAARRWLKEQGNPRVRSCRLKGGSKELIYQPARRPPKDKYG